MNDELKGEVHIQRKRRVSTQSCTWNSVTLAQIRITNINCFNKAKGKLEVNY